MSPQKWEKIKRNAIGKTILLHTAIRLECNGLCMVVKYSEINRFVPLNKNTGQKTVKKASTMAWVFPVSVSRKKSMSRFGARNISRIIDTPTRNTQIPAIPRKDFIRLELPAPKFLLKIGCMASQIP